MNDQELPPSDGWTCIAHPLAVAPPEHPNPWQVNDTLNRISCLHGRHHIGIALPRAINDRQLAKIAAEVARVLNATNASPAGLPEIKGIDLLHFGPGNGAR